ncbi:hypothetical protein EDC94DRAFT_580098 [Helicostylum pulchrum]|nr:hypothetical protein EDC94DRAFT_580098 [Helicostylum pulchrum]
MNSILDLFYEFGEAQSTLFTEEQWSTLKSRFAVEEGQDADMDDNLIAIIDSFLRTVESMLTAKTSFSIKMNKLSSWVEHTKNSRMLNSEERFILFITQHLLKLHQKTSYLFNVEIDCSERGFVLKSRSTRYMVKLFNNDDLRTKWGDTVFKIGNEDGSTDLKIDLRVLLDTTVQRHNVENDISSGEFAKYDPGRLKHQSDRCKLMIEGKIIINNMISRDIDICSIPILQICGTELIILVNPLVAPGLYVGNELHSFSLLNTFENFKLVPDLVKRLEISKQMYGSWMFCWRSCQNCSKTKGINQRAKVPTKNRAACTSKEAMGKKKLDRVPWTEIDAITKVISANEYLQMASQRNNITLPEVQMLLQRTIMNESQSILGKLDNLDATINDLKEDAIAAKEENMSLKEELSSLKNKINMIYSSETYHKLAERVTGRPMTKEEFDSCCEDNVNIGVLNPVMYTIKKRYDLLKKPINFAKLPSEAELLSEEKAAPFSPLAACAGRWGEKMLLMRMWHRTSQYYIDEEGENRVAAQTILKQEEQEEQEEEQ